jgi:hypothetical protein
VRKSVKKIVTVCDERWVLRQIKTNPKLRVTQLATEIEHHRHKIVNHETFQRILRKNDFHGREAREKSFISQKNQKVQMEFIANHLQKSLEIWKTVPFADESRYNIFG